MVACQSAYLVLEKEKHTCSLPLHRHCRHFCDIFLLLIKSWLLSYLSGYPKQEYTLPLMSLECFEDGGEVLSDVGSGQSSAAENLNATLLKHVTWEEHRRMLCMMLQLCKGRSLGWVGKRRKSSVKRCWVNSSPCRHEAVRCFFQSILGAPSIILTLGVFRGLAPQDFYLTRASPWLDAHALTLIFRVL